MTRVCVRCGRELDISEFHKNGARNGAQRYKSTCKYCLAEDVRARYKRQKAVLNGWKSPCAKCGETRLYVLDFHHIDPEEKDFTIGRASLRSAKQLYEEVKKCVVLCANCHREFHWLTQHEGVTIEEYLNMAH